MQRSLWSETVTMPTFPSLEQDAKTDVLIVGGGMTGLLCAHALSQAGIDHLLIEADTVASGVTGNTTAKITSQHGAVYHKLLQTFGKETARSHWEANEAALARYRALAASMDCDWKDTDSYLYATGSPQQLEQELSALQTLGIPADDLTELPLPFKTTGAIRFRHQAQFHPLKFLSHLISDLNIREHTRAQAFHGRTAVTNKGKITAQKIIIATHFPIINKHGSYFLKLYQQRSYVLGLEGAPTLDGMYRDCTEGGFSLRSHGATLLLGGSSHRTGKPSSGWSALENAARQWYPSCRTAYRWATQDCMSLDGLPYIGPYSSSTPDLYTATGFNKWGMTGSMVAAQLLCDLVQGKDSPYAPIFSPSRSILRPQLLANVLESSKNLLTLSKPRCPHLGCALKWNRNERTWDCPCHGSRFSPTGKLHNGPATADLPHPPSPHP